MLTVNKIGQKVEPYDINSIIKSLSPLLERYSPPEILFNLTGATKLMVFAGFILACQKTSPFCYLQSESEGGNSLIYLYEWENGVPKLKNKNVIPDLINIDDYLRVHIGTYYEKPGFDNKFEEYVYNVLGKCGYEIKHNVLITSELEVDLIMRCRNQFGIAEIKMGGKATKKEGLDQLNTAGGREYLGTYTRKILIINRPYPPRLKELAEARGIRIIELTRSSESGIDRCDEEILRTEIKSIMESYEKNYH
jgi:hypothetical protein